MNDILHANIFFFITSVAVVVLALMWVVILFYVIAILREVRAIVERICKVSGDIEEDLQALRASVRHGGARVRSLGGIAFEFLVRMLSRPPRRSQSRRSRTESEDDDLVE